jgi:hypothetical protein
MIVITARLCWAFVILCFVHSNSTYSSQISHVFVDIHFQELLLVGNPCYEIHGDDKQKCRNEVLKRLPKLKKLDGMMVSDAEVEAAQSSE